MANRKPLVLASGEHQQLQAADALAVTLLGGVLVYGAGEAAANGIYYPTGAVRNGEPVRVNPLTDYEMAIDLVVSDPAGGGAAVLQWGIFRSQSHGTTGAYYGDESSGQPYDSAWNTGNPATDIPPWGVFPIPSVVQAMTTVPADDRSLPQNSQSANYTTVLADENKHLLHPSADTTARTFTIAANASVGYRIGTRLLFINQNAAGLLTIAVASDILRRAGYGGNEKWNLTANGIASARKVTATEWLLDGTGLVFFPRTNTYNTGSTNEAVPFGATSLTITSWGGGGGGSTGSTTTVSGGGAGAYSLKTIAIAPADWGVNLAYVVGAGGAGHASGSSGNGSDGTDTTISGTLAAGAVAMTAGKGFGGVVSVGGTGGTASGGGTNTSGGAGTLDTTTGKGGDSPNGGAGGANINGAGGTPGTAPGGGGGGAGSMALTFAGAAGAAGRITFAWT